MPRRGALLGAIGVAVAAASVVVVGIVWPGLDARETPPADASLWALQTGEGRRYARVNTAVGELDTVRSVANPSAVAQASDGAYLFAESYGRLARIDEALPVDLDDESLGDVPATPPGTTEVAVAGDYVAYLTESGSVLAGTLGGTPTEIQPDQEGGEDAAPYLAEAVTVDDAGTVFSWSRDDGAVVRWSIPRGELLGTDAMDAVPPGDVVGLTAAGDTWFLIDTTARQAWRRGSDAVIPIPLTGDLVLGIPSATATAAYIADASGLVSLPAGGGDPRQEAGGGGGVLGTPARPRAFGDVIYAAWLGPQSGLLWRSDGSAAVDLDYGGQSLDEERAPVLAASATSIMLNETLSGWVWNGDGGLLPSSQSWTLEDEAGAQSGESDEQAAVELDPKPPVAEPDAFGVRAGRLATLPVLLNDSDPNEDVLSIDPASVTGLDPGFGTVSVTDNGQRFAVQVQPGADGTAAFSYRVTDGTAADGRFSSPATVTLTVAGEEQNSAPVWCGVVGCLADWPSPEVAPGGTVSASVQGGWVDPEGDPVMLLAAADETGAGAVATTPAGEVVYQHGDASLAEELLVPVQVTVADTRSAQATKELVVRVGVERRLRADSFTVVDSIGAAITVDVGPHVTGTEGRLRLTSVRVLDDTRADAVAAAGGTAFDLTAREPGVYQVAYAVSDGDVEANAVVRITVLPDDAPAQLSTAPVVAFVHPQEDVTVDVFAAVTNPTHRVLLLSEVRPVTAPGSSMTVDAVAQNFLRVTGSTADGAPGLLGTVRYTVSDGTQDTGARIEGEASVYLLPPAPEIAPIAVDDVVTVRAGAQVDIPVLDNDVATAGGAVTLNPARVTSVAEGGLAFGSGRVIRYLAPSVATEDRIDYEIFAAGSPSLGDAAGVTVRVIDGQEENRAPRPETLEGRVLSGATTTIPFRSFGVDLDGDDVSLDRVTRQPGSGTATVSADGESIVYTSVAGFRGQVRFEYRVVDDDGAAGTASVRVGVLGEQANPSPVTFTDYVQLQAGTSSSVRVSPLANDIDPTGGTLTLTDVRPDLAETLDDGAPNPEFERVDALLGARSTTQVVIRAGESPGTMSFLYDVESSSGNTARGLVVVKVVREAVPDYPVVADTVLTAETRDRFPSGVDVVAGKVAWSGGDVAALRLSLWGDPAGVTAAGNRIRGAVPAETRIIPFALTGVNATGEQVTTYAFLRVPGDDDLPLALRADVGPQPVREAASHAWDMADLVSVPPDADIEVSDAVAATGARASAACVHETGTRVRYDAGVGAPWTDACVVPVRLTGADEWTYLSVPVAITPTEPQPVLRAASLTVGPGETVRYDLRTMTSWQGGTEGAGIRYAVDFAGSAFSVTSAAGIVTITGADAAIPGTEESATVRVESQAGVAPARLALRVGAAPSTLPRGGTVAATCSQAAASSCTVTVSGAPGEVNPLPRTPLRVEAVRATGSCAGVTFSVASATAIAASWTADAPGATCTAAVSLRDAQGRVTQAERDAQAILDLQGYPRVPASVVQTGYGDGTLTLQVDPGDARAAYPALTGFVIRWQGQVVAQCAPDGTCPQISAPNGEQRLYQATAQNSVGESRGSVTVTAWAYDAPPRPQDVAAAPIVTGTDGAPGGYVGLRITGLDTGQTGSVQITSPAGETLQLPVGRSDSTIVVPRYFVGSNTASPVTVTPLSRFTLPPGLGANPTGESFVVTTNGIGAPLAASLGLTSTSNGDGTSTIAASATATRNGDGSELRYGITPVGRSCSATGEPTATFTVDDGVSYSYQVCVESWYGGTSFGRATATAEVRAEQSGRAPQGWTFVVDGTAELDGAGAKWIIRAAPTSTETPPRNNRAEFDGLPSSVIGRDPGVRVRYVHETWGTATDWTPVTPAAGSAPYQVRADWAVSSCVAGAPLALAISSTDDRAVITADPAAAVYYDAVGALLPLDPAGLVPIGATRVELAVSADWSATGWNLQTATATLQAECTATLPVPPAP